MNKNLYLILVLALWLLDTVDASTVENSLAEKSISNAIQSKKNILFS